jgi:hypothetical protein
MHSSEPATIRLRAEQFRHHARKRGLKSDSASATYLGLNRSTVLRILNDDMAPGERMIAQALAAFPDLTFEDLFEVVIPAAKESAA